MLCILAKFPLVSIFLTNNMSQLQFLGGCLTRRPEILTTSQSSVEIVLCVILDVLIYFTRRIN